MRKNKALSFHNAVRITLPVFLLLPSIILRDIITYYTQALIKSISKLFTNILLGLIKKKKNGRFPSLQTKPTGRQAPDPDNPPVSTRTQISALLLCHTPGPGWMLPLASLSQLQHLHCINTVLGAVMPLENYLAEQFDWRETALKISCRAFFVLGPKHSNTQSTRTTGEEQCWKPAGLKQALQPSNTRFVGAERAKKHINSTWKRS